MSRLSPPQGNPVCIVLALTTNIVEAFLSSRLQVLAEHQDSHVEDVTEILDIELIAPVPVTVSSGAPSQQLIAHTFTERDQLGHPLRHNDNRFLAGSATSTCHRTSNTQCCIIRVPVRHRAKRENGLTVEQAFKPATDHELSGIPRVLKGSKLLVHDTIKDVVKKLFLMPSEHRRCGEIAEHVHYYTARACERFKGGSGEYVSASVGISLNHLLEGRRKTMKEAIATAARFERPDIYGDVCSGRQMLGHESLQLS